MSVTCTEVLKLIPLYVDGELDALRIDEVERHVSDCPECLGQLEMLQRLSQAVRAQYDYQPLPDSVLARIEAATVRPLRAHPVRWFVPFAAGLAIGAAAIWMVVPGLVRKDRFAQQLVSSHVRSLMLNNLVDVPSSDRHTVKPWFQGKLSFSPTVPDLAKQGFPLLGGRLEYLEERPAAALVYRRNRHIINVFVTDNPVFGLSEVDSAGFHVRHFRFQGLEYWAVSEVSEPDLKEFEEAFVASGA